MNTQLNWKDPKVTKPEHTKPLIYVTYDTISGKPNAHHGFWTGTYFFEFGEKPNCYDISEVDCFIYENELLTTLKKTNKTTPLTEYELSYEVKPFPWIDEETFGGISLRLHNFNNKWNLGLTNEQIREMSEAIRRGIENQPITPFLHSIVSLVEEKGYYIPEVSTQGQSIPEEEWGVHRTHCCKDHGCKYAEEKCPVVLGQVEQEYLCELCLVPHEHANLIAIWLDQYSASQGRKKWTRSERDPNIFTSNFLEALIVREHHLEYMEDFRASHIVKKHFVPNTQEELEKIIY